MLCFIFFCHRLNTTVRLLSVTQTILFVKSNKRARIIHNKRCCYTIDCRVIQGVVSLCERYAQTTATFFARLTQTSKQFHPVKTKSASEMNATTTAYAFVLHANKQVSVNTITIKIFTRTHTLAHAHAIKHCFVWTLVRFVLKAVGARARAQVLIVFMLY